MMGENGEKGKLDWERVVKMADLEVIFLAAAEVLEKKDR